jgi:transcriptional regulator with PAS, ATPase and Fis domain
MAERPAKPSDSPTRSLGQGETPAGSDPRDLCLLLSYAEGVSVAALGAGSEVVLGRGTNSDVVVPDDSVSRRHARLSVSEQAITLEDLGSANGTTVDGERLVPGAPVFLRIGSAFELGKTTIVLQRSQGLNRHSAHTVRPAVAGEPFKPNAIIHDPAMKRLYALLEVIGPSPLSILILGETGVGKEVFADAAHLASGRASKPFLRLNCAALPESILEGELFGYERGAFTGAAQAKAGLFESADGGTVFLDEIGEVPLVIQSKLLRFLESGEVLRLGSLKPKVVDVRIISATNRELRELMAGGQFRPDLFFRLNGMSVTLPPLRKRVAEIVPLAEMFAARLAEQQKRRVPFFADDAKRALEAYEWPGNVRELRNVIERAVVMTRGDLIGRDTLDLGGDLGEAESVERGVKVASPPSESIRPRTSNRQEAASLAAQLEAVEKQGVVDALGKTGGNQTQAAKLLGISRRGLIRKIEQYGLTRPRKRDGEEDDEAGG